MRQREATRFVALGRSRGMDLAATRVVPSHLSASSVWLATHTHTHTHTVSSVLRLWTRPSQTKLTLWRQFLGRIGGTTSPHVRRVVLVIAMYVVLGFASKGLCPLGLLFNFAARMARLLT